MLCIYSVLYMRAANEKRHTIECLFTVYALFPQTKNGEKLIAKNKKNITQAKNEWIMEKIDFCNRKKIKKNNAQGPAEIWTRVAGLLFFIHSESRVLDHYTTEPHIRSTP